MNGYPYPVLTEIDSPYKKNINFNIEFSKCTYKEDKIILSIGIDLNSETLKKHITDKNAELVIKVLTGIRSLLFHIQGIPNSIDITINSEDIRSNDTIDLTAFVISKKEFKFTTTSEMKSDFGDNFSILLKKGDILAISNKEKLNYNTTTNDFIMISSSDEMENKGIKINLKNDNHICILVSPSFKHAYATLKNNTELSTILEIHLVFEAFVYTLVELAQEKEDHSNKEWYRLFVQALETIGETIDNFKTKAMDDHNVDMSYIFEIAQEMINNSLETSVISIKESEVKYDN